MTACFSLWRAPALPFVLLLGSVTAQQWHVDGGPRWQHAAAIDTARNVLVVLGRHGDTHEWNGQVWRRRPADGPRAEQTRMFEVAPGRIVALVPPFAILSETWQYDGATWRNLAPATRPATRFDAAMALDTVRSRVVMFGGADFNGTGTAETWEFDGANWALRSFAAAPPPMRRAAMAFDSSRGRCVLFGGERSDGTILGATWEYDGVSWQQRTVAAPPTARTGHAMAFDRTRNRTVMFSGYGTLGPALDLGEWDGNVWTSVVPAPAPDQHFGHELVFDPARGEVLAVAGGPPGSEAGAILAWNGVRLQRLGALPEAPTSRNAFAMVASPNGVDALLFGGALGDAPVFGDLWRWDGRRWSLLAASGPPPRVSHAMWPDLAATYVFGGVPVFPAPPTDDLWRWNGTAWQALTPAVRPAARWGGVVAFDLPRNRAVLFGGQGSNLLGDTWEFDGSVWTQMTPAQSPSPRIHHSMAGNAVAGRVVLFGGFDYVNGLAETWEWNGSIWTQISTAQQPNNPIGGSFAYDVRTSECIYAVQRSLGLPDFELWSYANGVWRQDPWPVAQPTGFGGRVFATTGHAGIGLFDGSIVHHLAMSPPAVVSYGAACGSAPPVLAAHTLPRIQEPLFGFEISRAVAAQPVALIGGLQQVAVPLPGCTLLASPDAVVVAVADGLGNASYSVPVPPLASLLGVTLFWQAAGLQPGSANGFAMSAGQRIVIGD